jgi:glutathione synthase/RimK-type ligase-like ATP-grasp enzyme
VTALAGLFADRRMRAIPVDPLDAFYLVRGDRTVLHHDPSLRHQPDAVLTFLHPFRADVDLLFLEALPDSVHEVRNTPGSLTAFRDPFRVHAALARARLPVPPMVRLRKPVSVDRIVDILSLPLEVRIPLGHGRFGLARFEDKGSLRGIVDVIWRSDGYVVATPAPDRSESERWVPVVDGSAFEEDADLAVEAARILGLSMACVRLRDASDGPCIVEVHPYPAPPTEPVREDVLDAVAALV